MDKIKYISLFSGIGGFEYGIQQSEYGEYFECIGFSEIDKYAESIYKKQFPNHINWGDATEIRTEDLPDFQLLVGGFPCQAFSVAGKRRGFDDTRGTLFFEIARILKDKRPRYFLLENVRGLLSHDKGKTFQTILTVLSSLGYYVKWEVFNSKNHSVPQNRERIFIKGYFRGECSGEVLLEKGDSRQGLEEEITDNRKISNTYYNNRQGRVHYHDELMNTLATAGHNGGGSQLIIEDTPKLEKVGNVFNGGGQAGNVYDIRGLSPTLAANGGGAGGRTGLYLVPTTSDENFFSVTTRNRQSPLSKRQDNYVIELEDNRCMDYEKLPLKVYKRKYTLCDDELLELHDLLRDSKKESKLTNQMIADELELPVSTVEHYFRKKMDYWSIPDKKVWFKLKDLLGINVDKFDDFVTVFIECDGVYDMSNRCYNTDGLSPTLNTGDSTLIKTEDERKIKVIDECIGSTQKHASRTDGSYSPTLTASMGIGGGHVPMVKYSDECKIQKVGNVYKDSGSNGDVYHEEWLSPTILTGTKGNMHKVLVDDNRRINRLGSTNNHQSGDVYGSDGLSRTLCCTDWKAPMKIINTEEKDYRIRRLTPRECEKLQAFPVDWTKYGKDGELISDTQRYKCCGNAVTTTVIRDIINEMFTMEDFNAS